METGKLSGKIAVITGGSSGIGLATAKRFVEEGAYVFITGRRQAELDKAVAEIGSNVTAVQGDVSNLDDLDRLYKEVATKKGKLDVLFANAGIVAETNSSREPGALRQDFRCQCARGFLCSAKGPAPDERGRIDHPDRLGSLAKRHPGLCNLWSNEGCSALVRAHLDGGVRRQRNPREYDQPRPRRNTYSQRSV